MPRYYCEYCHSYLTHDTLSVRKSHLRGKNHLRITQDYYRNKAVAEARAATHRHRHRQKTHRKLTAHTAETQRKVATHTRKEKKALRHRAAAASRELLRRDVRAELQATQRGSPGYARVWDEARRFDVGAYLRSAAAPRRANARAGGDSRENGTRHSGTVPTALGPPPVLAEWAQTVPRTRQFAEVPRVDSGLGRGAAATAATRDKRHREQDSRTHTQGHSAGAKRQRTY
ncbi:Yhc1 protein [Maudiozyma humilis]|uniref:Yhc1 protein n=1 Tax=Maudiozyma humilis TaxID=51915 RepID=A0AAV5RX25_MAUHU|nr:Yhc1 protein [Kazachstania humilis]